MAAANEKIVESSSLEKEFVRRNIIVTGFGPFHGHPVNASWEAVKLLPFMDLEGELDINLITEQIPVKYDVIETKIPELWAEHKPLLVIHVGVSSSAKNITLERCASRSGYKRCDIDGQIPTCGSCCLGNEDTIFSTLDFLKISKKINSLNGSIETSVSTDAGRYCCEYIYYTSLSQDNSRCIFVHVPDLEKPYSANQIAIGLSKLIQVLVEELRLTS